MPKSTTPTKISKKVVDAIHPDPNKDVFTWDGGDGAIKGFGIRTKPSGTSSYMIQYRNKHGRQRKLVLGRVGVLTPDEARRAAGEKLNEVAGGGDPSADRHLEREALTVNELADLYLRDGPAEKPNKKASSWGADRSNIERHIKPLLGRKIAKTLTQADIAKFQADVAAGKTKADIKTKKQGRAIIKGGRGTAARSLAVLAAMLQLATGRKLLPENPAKNVPLLKGKKKERFLSAGEVTRWADTIAVMEQDRPPLSQNAANGLRLLLLTGCRKTEIMSLQWPYVDFERRHLRLPDSKTGAKVVPLGDAALEILRGLPRLSTTWVFPASRRSKKGHYDGLQDAWERVRDRADLPGLRLHDLRHSFASIGITDPDTGLFTLSKVLGHKDIRSTMRYLHLAADPLIAAADRTSAWITAAMRGTDNIVAPDFSAKRSQSDDADAPSSRGGAGRRR